MPRINVFLLVVAITLSVVANPLDSKSKKLIAAAEEAQVAIPEACWIAYYNRGLGSFPSCKKELEKDAGLCYKPCVDGMNGVGPVCWPQTLSYGRGVGKIPIACGSERPEYDAGLCYKYCEDGYKGVGPVCWDFPKSYGRGVGRIPNVCSEGLEFQHGLCYKPCDKGFYGVGPVCWAEQKPYGRGVGTIPGECEEGTNYHVGLCYSPCTKEYSGIGPICWQNECESFLPFKCGPLCTKDIAKCAELIQKTGQQGYDIYNASDQDISVIISLLLKIYNGFNGYPTCAKVAMTLEDHPAAKGEPATEPVDEPVKEPVKEPESPKSVDQTKSQKKNFLGIPDPFQAD